MYGLHFTRQTGATKFAAITARKRRLDFWKERLEEVMVKFDRVRRATTIYFTPNEILAQILGPLSLLCRNVLISVHSYFIPNFEVVGIKAVFVFVHYCLRKK